MFYVRYQPTTWKYLFVYDLQTACERLFVYDLKTECERFCILCTKFISWTVRYKLFLFVFNIFESVFCALSTNSTPKLTSAVPWRRSSLSRYRLRFVLVRGIIATCGGHELFVVPVPSRLRYFPRGRLCIL
jgi:hypothetical protein